MISIELLLASMEHIVITHLSLTLWSFCLLLMLNLLHILLVATVDGLLVNGMVLLIRRSVHCHLLSLVLLNLLIWQELQKMGLMLRWLGLLLWLILLKLLELALVILVHQLLHHLVVLSDGLVGVCVGHLESLRLLLQGGGLDKTLVVIVGQRVRELLLLDLLML